MKRAEFEAALMLIERRKFSELLGVNAQGDYIRYEARIVGAGDVDVETHVLHGEYAADAALLSRDQLARIAELNEAFDAWVAGEGDWPEERTTKAPAAAVTP